MKKNYLLYDTINFIRSLIFSITMIAFTIVHSFICLAVFPCSMHVRYKVVTFWTDSISKLLRVICGVNYKVDGLENIPKDRVGVVISKHQSIWETCYLPGHFNDAAIILKRELLFVPFFGWGMTVISPITINRAEKSSAMEQVMTKGKQALQEKRWIIVYPEGTRIAPGQIGNYRLGGARLAVASGVPVIPVAHNAGYYWPKRKFLKRPGTIHLVIGKPIETVGKTAEMVMAETKEWIENECKRIGR